MARSTANADVWSKSGLALEEQRGSTRANTTARDAFDEYQDKRAIEGALATSLFYNDTECAKQPALGVDNILGGAEYAATWITPPQCFRVSPADLGWERREQIFGSTRGANNVTGPASDKLLADPSLGWSDVLDIKGDGGSSAAASSARAPAVKSGAQPTAPMTRSSGVSMTPSNAPLDAAPSSHINTGWRW